MNILCHRGYWQNSFEKNTKPAFLRGYELGLGTETDIRDFNGDIVISHDPASSASIRFLDFLDLTPKHLLLALNVKSDGLAQLAHELLIQKQHQAFFFFDMSIPDLVTYQKRGLPYAVRVSEYEQFNSGLENEADYIWLDGFNSVWYSDKCIENLLSTKKTVVVVSDELHGRPHLPHWNRLKTFNKAPNMILCTDFPEQAQAYFGVIND